MLWCSFKQHPSTEALPDLAEAQQAHLRAVLGLTRKVLVTDLDNTLWKGIIGEDGLEGIQVGREQRWVKDINDYSNICWTSKIAGFYWPPARRIIRRCSAPF